MEGEIYRAFKVWLTILLSLRYCYALRNITREGFRRLFCLLPVIVLFLYLPLHLHSINICGITAFFIAWLGNFKLLLFAFGKGPLSFEPSMSCTHFILVACLPIRIQQQPVSRNPKNGRKSPLSYVIKIFLWFVMLPLFVNRENLHPGVLHVLYSLHIYICLESVLAIAGSFAKTMMGIELEPQFDEPYLSCSLQEFWGRRWNLTVSSILRPTVYNPVRSHSSPAVAVISSFLVSGLLHELIFFYLGRTTPTWEVTCFFALHGVCVVAETGLKNYIVTIIEKRCPTTEIQNGRYEGSTVFQDSSHSSGCKPNRIRSSLNPTFLTKNLRLLRLVYGVMTLAFVLITASWLFFPQFLRCKAVDGAFEDYAAIWLFFKTLVPFQSCHT